MNDLCQLVGKNLLRFVYRLPSHVPKAPALPGGQESVEEEKLLHIVVGYIPPVLEKIVGAAHRRIKKHRAFLCFSHLFPIGTGNQRESESDNLPAFNTANQVHPGDNVTPLIITAYLQGAAIAAVKFEEIVGLEKLVVELDKGKTGFEPFLVGFKGKHPVYRKMLPYVPEELYVIEWRKPFGVIHHGSLVGIYKPGYLFRHLFSIFLDILDGKHLPHFGFTRWIADPRGSAPYEGYGFMSGFLKMGHREEGNEVPRVERWTGWIKPTVKPDPTFVEETVQEINIGTLLEKSPFL